VVRDVSTKLSEATASKRRQQIVLTQTTGVLGVLRLIRSFLTPTVLKRYVSKCVLSFPTAQKKHFLSSFLPTSELYLRKYLIFIAFFIRRTLINCAAAKLQKTFNNKAGGTLYLQGLWATPTSSPSICTFFCKICQCWKQPTMNVCYQIRGKISFCPKAAPFGRVETKF